VCGTSTRNSHPSILVFCRPSEFKDLRNLLLSNELKYQYCIRRPGRKRWWIADQGPTTHEGSRPLFNIYFWRQHRPRTLYCAKGAVETCSTINMPPESRFMDLHIASRISMCGAMVEIDGPEDRCFSTLGCVVKIKSSFFGITAMHGLSTVCPEPQPLEPPSGTAAAAITSDKTMELSQCDQGPSGGSDTHSIDERLEEYGYISDDVEYEDVEEENQEQRFVKNNSKNSISGEFFVPVVRPEILDIHTLREDREEDLDWALIRLQDPEHWRPNAYICPSTSPSPVFLTALAETVPTHETPVLIITSRAPPRKGLLQPGTSALGGIRGTMSATLWTLILCDQNSESFIFLVVRRKRGTNLIRLTVRRLRVGCRRCYN
jgi:hypothetical protein